MNRKLWQPVEAPTARNQIDCIQIVNQDCYGLSWSSQAESLGKVAHRIRDQFASPGDFPKSCRTFFLKNLNSYKDLSFGSFCENCRNDKNAKK